MDKKYYIVAADSYSAEVIARDGIMGSLAVSEDEMHALRQAKDFHLNTYEVTVVIKQITEL
jgi:hypothetical protein